MTLFEKIVKISNRIDNASTEEDVVEIISMITNDEQLQTDDMFELIANMIKTGINYSNIINKQLLNDLHERLSKIFEHYFADSPGNWIYPGGIKLAIESSDTENVYEKCKSKVINNVKKGDIVSIYDKNDKLLFKCVIKNDEQKRIFILFEPETSFGCGYISIRPYCNAELIYRDLGATKVKKLDIGKSVFKDEPEVVEAIRNDDLDYLQKFVTSYEFEPNRKYLVSKEPYQQYPNTYIPSSSLMNITLLYGSVKCFKYLYSNNKYENSDENCFNLIVGGSIEIFKILENEHRLDKFIKNIMIYSITYHNNDVAKYLISKHDITAMLKDIIITTIDRYNFEIINYLIKNEYIDINNLLTVDDNDVKKIKPSIQNIAKYMNTN